MLKKKSIFRTPKKYFKEENQSISRVSWLSSSSFGMYTAFALAQVSPFMILGQYLIFCNAWQQPQPQVSPGDLPLLSCRCKARGGGGASAKATPHKRANAFLPHPPAQRLPVMAQPCNITPDHNAQTTHKLCKKTCSTRSYKSPSHAYDLKGQNVRPLATTTNQRDPIPLLSNGGHLRDQGANQDETQ